MARTIGITKQVVSAVINNELGHQVNMDVTLHESGTVMIRLMDDHDPDNCVDTVMSIKEALTLHKLLGNLPLPKLR